MDRMKYNSHYILQLYVQKVVGSISEDDLRLLEDVLRKDAEMRALCAEWDRDLTPEEVTRQQDPELTKQRWQRIKNLYEERGPQREREASVRKIRGYVVSGVAAAAVLAIGFFVLRTPEERPSSKPLLATNTTENAEMILPSGEAVTLDEALSDKQMTIGDVSLSYSKGKLVLSAGHGAGAGIASLNVPVGKQLDVTLTDGTVAMLNSASTFKFPLQFDGANRSVELAGEAYFTVAGNAERPFIVQSHGTKVVVLGTEFNVNSYNPKNIITSLRSGSVRMQGGGKDTLLKPGQAARVQDGVLTVSKVKEDRPYGWTKGIVDLEGASVAEIAAIISRWYDIKVDFARPELKEGSYDLSINKSEPVEEALKRLRKISSEKVKYKIEGKHLKFE
ncbi:FecR domain-containing protein [Chitinophaga horti]|uniref:FecR domain-containing protein n=1 Tax=Chitinophaga horti TaxID=2920382 RepID=A0ABY6J4V1_9BACT|nr:FecR domain-containing protein [Chitinophaga horti]UYQ94698.1 FecR domain-containing protein [Chitinophaga horti]